MSTTLNQDFLYCAFIFNFWVVKLRTGTEVKLLVLVIVLFPFETITYHEVLWLLNSHQCLCLRLNLPTSWEHAVEALQGEGWDISNQNQDSSICTQNRILKNNKQNHKGTHYEKQQQTIGHKMEKQSKKQKNETCKTGHTNKNNLTAKPRAYLFV